MNHDTLLPLELLHCGQWAEVADVTGDGILDIIAGACRATINGVGNTGAIYVWAGGPTLRGNLSPTATLVSPAGAPGCRACA